MLILINTAVDTTFVFSIDDHELEIIEMDFVPIRPYKRTSILVGIGAYLYPVASPPELFTRSRSAISCHRHGQAPQARQKRQLLDSNHTSKTVLEILLWTR